MPTSKEFAIQLEDRPGKLAKLTKALADKGVNIVGFQSTPIEGNNSQVRFIVDNPTTAKAVLDLEHMSYKENEVALAKLPHRPGALSRAASQLADSNINIDYGYCGVDATTNTPLLIFGVADAAKAASILDRVSVAAA
ncbi:MAG TPA: ACT domain-containing protein [Terriglobales bacterium]|nr:ACT domain-containing protein [Terriglobales bacterium]